MSGPPDLVAAAFHWLEFLGLLGAIGSFVIRRLGRIKPHIRWANPPMQIALGAALAGGVGLLVLAPSWPVAVRVVSEGAALYFCVRGNPYVAPFAVLAMVLLSVSGHAARVLPAAGAEFADALHVISAAMWAGGILALASLHPPGGWGSTEARMLIHRFGRVALIAFGVTALSGFLRATEHLNALGELWRTPYGLVLSFKIVGVFVMFVLSTLAWRRGLTVARLEAGLAVVVVGATALLAAFPLQA